MDFIRDMENTAKRDIKFNGAVTENGALGYATSLDKLVDINFKVASYRNMSEDEIISDFMAAFKEDPVMAFTWLFFARDVRGGLGERRLFRVCLNAVLNHYNISKQDLMSICHLILEFGRADDLYTIKSCGMNGQFVFCDFIDKVLRSDLQRMAEGKPVSLLAKWLKSETASSIESRVLAKETMYALGMSPKKYRKTLSKLRKYIDVVECKMTAGEWNKIDYSKVPSKAGLNYSDAFRRHDEDRYDAYLDAVKRGKEKINAGTLYPYEIVSKYIERGTWGFERVCAELNPTLEEMWKALPNTVNGKHAGSTIVVADGSGSMMSRVCGNTTALDVANSLAIYFAERMEGPFKNKYITFSNRPRFVDLSNCVSLREKLVEALKHDECSTTNIEAVFDLMLKTAVGCGMEQSEMPANVLIVSDMEFNGATDGRVDRSLFDGIRERFEAAGYKLPRLVFWNVNSRTCVVPIQENDAGVALVSGFSQNIAEMVMSGEIDPAQCLVNTLNKDRYDVVKDVAQSIFGEKKDDFYSELTTGVVTYF